MKKSLFAFASALAMIAMSGSSEAAITLSADMDAATPGVQSTVVANVGDRVTVDFVFDLTENSSLSAWQYSVRYNTNNLSLVTRQEIAPPGFGFVETDPQMVDSPSTGFLFRFGFDAAAGPTAAFGPFRVGSVVFDVVGHSPSAFGVDVEPGFFEPDLDTFLVNDTFAEVPRSEITFIGGTVTAIPEPSSLAVIGLIGAAGAYRARRRRSAEVVA